MKRTSKMRRNAQRGSALLIVFVFAAIIAISLYAEMPIAAFEARREKEQLLIDRGHEYAHAVKLYVRKFGSYPPTIDALEDTNRMRFLRHRYKDPFTGKTDWRLLHAGPGGMLVDSKVKPLGQQNQNPAAATLGQGLSSGFGSVSTATNNNTNSASNPASSQGGFGSSSFGSSSFGSSSFGSSSDSSEAVVVPPVPKRPPAISANGSSSGSASSETDSTAAVPSPAGEQSPTAPLLSPGETDQMAGSSSEPGAQSANASAGQNGQPSAGAASNGAGSQGAFSNRPQQTLLPGSGTPGATMGGGGLGIAGVASIAKGHSIKTVNDQSDYSLWEFYYDPSKDSTRGAPGQGMGGQQGTTPNGVNTGAQQNQSIFGQSSTSTFGQSSSFGQTSTQPMPNATSTNSSTSTNPPQQ